MSTTTINDTLSKKLDLQINKKDETLFSFFDVDKNQEWDNSINLYYTLPIDDTELLKFDNNENIKHLQLTYNGNITIKQILLKPYSIRDINDTLNIVPNNIYFSLNKIKWENDLIIENIEQGTQKDFYLKIMLDSQSNYIPSNEDTNNNTIKLDFVYFIQY